MLLTDITSNFINRFIMSTVEMTQITKINRTLGLLSTILNTIAHTMISVSTSTTMKDRVCYRVTYIETYFASKFILLGDTTLSDDCFASVENGGTLFYGCVILSLKSLPNRFRNLKPI